MFSTQSGSSPFVHILDIISLLAAEFEKPKIGISGKGLLAIPHSATNTKALPCFPTFKIYHTQGFFLGLGEDTRRPSKREKCKTKAIFRENFL